MAIHHNPFSLVVWIIGALGILTTVAMLSLIHRAYSHLLLRRHRATNLGTADLLGYDRLIKDGLVLMKGGTLLACYLYKGADESSATIEEQQQTTNVVNHVLSRLGAGWQIGIDSVRRKSPGYSPRELSHFPDPVSAAIDEERRRYFEKLGTLYDNLKIMTISFTPPLHIEKRFVDFLITDEKEKRNPQRDAESVVELFERGLQTIEYNLSSVLSMYRLASEKVEESDGHPIVQDNLLRWLNYAATGLNHPVTLPPMPMDIDKLIGAHDLWGGFEPKIGEHFIKIVSLEGLPLVSYTGILNILAEVAVECRWNSRFICIEPFEAIHQYEKQHKFWRQKERGIIAQLLNYERAPLDRNAVEMKGDAEAGMADINSAEVGAGYFTSTIVLMDRDLDTVRESALYIEKSVNNLGFSARIETVGAMDAFFGTLPGHGYENVTRPLINSLNFADLIPTSTTWTGSHTAPCPLYPKGSPAVMECVTNGFTPFHFNTHVEDVGHAVFFGATGAGKSTHLALLLAQFLRYEEMRIIHFDVGWSMYPLCAAVGGQHFAIGGDQTELTFAPLMHLETETDRSFAVEWIELVLKINNVIPTPEQRTLIRNAIQAMSRSVPEDCLMRSMSAFVQMIQDTDIREVFKDYAGEGTYGYLMDAKEDRLDMSRFMVFEMERIMSMGDRIVLPVLSYLLYRANRYFEPGYAAVASMDEAWRMLKHPVVVEQLDDWYRTLRKKNCALILSTHSTEETKAAGLDAVVRLHTSTKIFLPNPHANNDAERAVYREWGLNYRECEILAQATPKREYYAVSREGRRLYELRVGPLAKAFIGNTDLKSVNEIKALRSKYGEAWVDYWLNARGLNLRDYLVGAS